MITGGMIYVFKRLMGDGGATGTARWHRRTLSGATFHCRTFPCRVSSSGKIGSMIEGLALN